MGTTTPLLEFLYEVGLKPIIPLQAAGALILPPISVPIAKATHFEATRPPSPPELPAQVLVLSYGFKDLPKILFSECPTYTN